MKERTADEVTLGSTTRGKAHRIQTLLLTVLLAFSAAMLTACLGTHAPSEAQGRAGDEIPGDDFHYEMALWYMYGCNNLRAARSELEMIGRDYEKYPDVERMLGVIRKYEDIIAHDRDYHSGAFCGGILFRWNGMLINGGYVEITVEGEEPVRIDEVGKAGEWYDWDFSFMPLLRGRADLSYNFVLDEHDNGSVVIDIEGWTPNPAEWAAWEAAGNTVNAGESRYRGESRYFCDGVILGEADFGKTVTTKTAEGLDAEVNFTPDVCDIVLYEDFTSPDGRPARAEVHLWFVWEDFDR